MEDYTSSHGKPSKALLGLFDILESFILAIVCVMLTYLFFVKFSIVDGSSMETTLHDGDYLLATNVFFSYEPEVGDVVIIQANASYNTKELNGDIVEHFYDAPLVKRVIATEGQTITINASSDKYTIFVDGQVVDTSRNEFIFVDQYPKFLSLCSYDEETEIYTVTVPEDSIFVLGDNRENSLDSRAFGFFHKRNVLGKAVFRINNGMGAVK